MPNKGRVIFAFVLVIYTIVMMAFVDNRRSDEYCNAVRVSILDSVQNRFVEPDDVIELLRKGKFVFVGEQWDNISYEDLEIYMRHHSSIKEAECYRTVDGGLQIDITQRRPMARVVTSTSSYYIDEDAEVMPLSDLYAAHVVVLTGYVTKEMAQNELYQLVSFLRENRLWYSMFLQIDVAKNGDVILIPRAGNHEIILGKIEFLEEKFLQLETLYKSEFNEMGWNRYKTINLKFKGQIICTKK